MKKGYLYKIGKYGGNPIHGPSLDVEDYCALYTENLGVVLEGSPLNHKFNCLILSKMSILHSELRLLSSVQYPYRFREVKKLIFQNCLFASLACESVLSILSKSYFLEDIEFQNCLNSYGGSYIPIIEEVSKTIKKIKLTPIKPYEIS